MRMGLQVAIVAHAFMLRPRSSHPRCSSKDALLPVSRNRDGRPVRKLHMASIHSATIRSRHVADRMNNTVSIRTEFSL